MDPNERPAQHDESRVIAPSSLGSVCMPRRVAEPHESRNNLPDIPAVGPRLCSFLTCVLPSHPPAVRALSSSLRSSSSPLLMSTHDELSAPGSPPLHTPDQISSILSAMRAPIPVEADDEAEVGCDLTKPVMEVFLYSFKRRECQTVMWHKRWWLIVTTNGVQDRPFFLQLIAQNCPMLSLAQWTAAADGHIKFLTPDEMTQVTIAENEGREPF